MCGARGETQLVGSDAKPRPKHFSGTHTRLGQGHICRILNSNFFRQLKRMRLHNCCITLELTKRRMQKITCFQSKFTELNQSHCIYQGPRLLKQYHRSLQRCNSLNAPSGPGTRRVKTDTEGKRRMRKEEEVILHQAQPDRQ